MAKQCVAISKLDLTLILKRKNYLGQAEGVFGDNPCQKKILFKHSIHVKNNLRNRAASNYASYFHKLFSLAGVVNHSLGGAKPSQLPVSLSFELKFVLRSLKIHV